MPAPPRRLHLEHLKRDDGPVLCIGFHPDDIDFHASGLVRSLTATGVEVIYVVATSGERAGLAPVREEEQRQSARIVGVREVAFLRLKDGSLQKEYARGRLTKRMENLLRAYRPSVVITFCPANLTTVSWGPEHPDHRYGALAVWDAVYPGARQAEVVPWWQFWRQPLAGHSVRRVLWFADDLQAPHEANCFVQVDAVWPDVAAAIRAHKTQWGDAAVALHKARVRALRAASRCGSTGLVEEYRLIDIT